jgi:hypothetical protein
MGLVSQQKGTGRLGDAIARATRHGPRIGYPLERLFDSLFLCQKLLFRNPTAQRRVRATLPPVDCLTPCRQRRDKIVDPQAQKSNRFTCRSKVVGIVANRRLVGE